MSERDVSEIREYVSPEFIANELAYQMRHELSAEEAALAGEAISSYRIPLVMDALRNEISRREERSTVVLNLLDSSDIIDLDDLVDDDENWFTGREDIEQVILNDGRFVNFTDFMLAQKQTHTSTEYTTNVFHTLVLFFYEDQPAKHAELTSRLRYQQSNQSWSNQYAPTHRFFLYGEALMPYATEKVPAEYKIPGVGRIGRRLIRAVLYDNEDIDTLLLAERSRFNR